MALLQFTYSEKEAYKAGIRKGKKEACEGNGEIPLNPEPSPAVRSAAALEEIAKLLKKIEYWLKPNRIDGGPQ